MKLLFIKNQILFPLNVGGNIRTYNILRHMAKSHDITFLCNTNASDSQHIGKLDDMGMRIDTVPWNNPTPDQWKFYWDLVWNLLSRAPFSVDKVTNPQLIHRAQQLAATEHYDAVICDFVQMATVALSVACRPRILFQHNAEAQVFERQAKKGRGWARRLMMSLQWRKMLSFEKRAGGQFDAIVSVSELDSAYFKRHYGWQHVEEIDTAVDIHHFVPGNQGVERQLLITFVASMDWLPNQDAAVYFVNEIWPQIRHEYPAAIFHIVGRNPSRTVKELEQVDGVKVLGTVPDVRPHLAEAQVIVVPLLAGSGTRIKIFEAMAMGKVVVSTSIGAEGLRVKDNENILIADTPGHFADAVVGVLKDSHERRRIGQNARELVCNNFSSEIVASQFEQICQRAVASFR